MIASLLWKLHHPTYKLSFFFLFFSFYVIDPQIWPNLCQFNSSRMTDVLNMTLSSDVMLFLRTTPPSSQGLKRCWLKHLALCKPLLPVVCMELLKQKNTPDIDQTAPECIWARISSRTPGWTHICLPYIRIQKLDTVWQHPWRQG